MAEIQYVRKIDDLIPLKLVFISCTNKTGLVSEDGIAGVPKNGILGLIREKNPDVKFVSTGKTYKIIKKAGLPVIEVSEYTGYPEMKTGLVKSLHPAIHAGVLAHKYSESDDEFMKKQNLDYFDAVIVNFYPLEEVMKKDDVTFEVIRQTIDVGGPTIAHNARKAFISTALITEPKKYGKLTQELEKNQGKTSLSMRLKLVKQASFHITKYMQSVNEAIQNTNLLELHKTYEIK
ncbi:hypothetical protein GOV08_02915 [Candidatus Woesearchaeota archaeon]|nr:hypothetical protein [Candidatus Woesearchaeota archaeon]